MFDVEKERIHVLVTSREEPDTIPLTFFPLAVGTLLANAFGDAIRVDDLGSKVA